MVSCPALSTPVSGSVDADKLCLQESVLCGLGNCCFFALRQLKE